MEAPAHLLRISQLRSQVLCGSAVSTWFESGLGLGELSKLGWVKSMQADLSSKIQTHSPQLAYISVNKEQRGLWSPQLSGDLAIGSCGHR